ncbi:hypothetical protein LTR84_005281 [Exophiala bonariae]|uniref:Myb-like domain-containing protein n=1 Tax=Exophiala bonariae TaxID=1690606 RepID=A0AAV9NPQ5_9EURO|nr:hypothetical protein LTR84_005281 [Exophiala bonariae]
MNGISQPLPGLLDTFQFQIPDLPALTDFQIAPLRDPAPTRPANVPLPLEPLASNLLNNSRQRDDDRVKRRAPKITPNDVLLAREAKKPHLAISELLEGNDGQDILPTQLPSFISLSVVEKSPIQAPTSLEYAQTAAQKRLRLDTDPDHVSLDSIRRLPRPAQKDERQSRRAPLLPAMVTGLHEPPPSAALLPSIDVASRPRVVRTVTSSKMHVKDMLTQSDPSASPPPSVPVPSASSQELVTAKQPSSSVNTPSHEAGFAVLDLQHTTSYRDNKPRRARRKWSEEETRGLLAGVQKYGIGKWKQILDDAAFSFCERSSVDLKDRYRVCANNDSFPKEPPPSRTPSNDDLTNTAQFVPSQPSSVPGDDLAPKSPTDSSQAPKQRRKRRAWTTSEDENLIRGVAKHGFQWTAIHDDPKLDLQHRRATDLRDRIRNRFPDGYKHAESAPLRSEVRKSEKSLIPSPIGHDDADMPPQYPSGSKSQQTPVALVSANIDAGGKTVNGQNRSTAAAVTMLIHNTDHEPESYNPKLDKEKDKDQLPGVTLPSFTLDVDDDMDWEDNRLPPLHEWDDIGL